MDSVTEAKIQETFEKLAVGRTTIIIAHRLSTVKNADDIAVMDSMEKKGAELVMQADPTSKRLTTADIRKSFAR